MHVFVCVTHFYLTSVSGGVPQQQHHQQQQQQQQKQPEEEMENLPSAGSCSPPRALSNNGGDTTQAVGSPGPGPSRFELTEDEYNYPQSNPFGRLYD